MLKKKSVNVNIKMLKAKSPAHLFLGEGGDVRISARVGAKPFCRKRRVSDSRGKTYAAGMIADYTRDSGKLTDYLISSVRAR